MSTATKQAPAKKSAAARAEFAADKQNTPALMWPSVPLMSPDRPDAACACGGGCPRCRNGARDAAEEARAQHAVARIATVPGATSKLANQLGKRRPTDTTVSHAVRETLRPHTGTLPADLHLRTGPDVDRTLTAHRARGLAVGNNILLGGPRLLPSATAFAGVFAHEAAHVASGGSRAVSPPRFGEDDTLPGSWYYADRRRHDELEAAETGEGRRSVLERLPIMSAGEVHRDAPGIAYRAQERGDIELAQAAAQRLLDVWLAGSDVPITLSPLDTTGDSVDILLSHVETAFGASQWTLGGTFLSIAMVQLVRAAHAAVLRRAPAGGTGEPGLDLGASMALIMLRSDENVIRTHVERARALIDTHSTAVMAAGDAVVIAQFEAMAESLHRAEVRAGPEIVSDLGTGGVIDAPAPARAGAGHTDRSETPPARPASVTTPVARAAEEIVDSPHAQLEHALVFISRAGPTTYGNIASPRYAVAGTLAGAFRLAGELFGRRSCVIVEDGFARDGHGARQVRYLVLALNVRLHVNSAGMTAGELRSIPDVEMLTPSWSRYFFLAIASGDLIMFAPPLLDYVRGISTSEEGASVTALGAEERRRTIFSHIDALITAGETQQAANALTYIGATGFALVDTETKIRYITTLLRAFTFEANEQTIVEAFRSVDDETELHTILVGLSSAGVLRQLRTDMEYSFTTLLTVLGEKFGGESVSLTDVTRLLHEIAILQVFPGVELRADGSFAFNVDLVGNLVSAVEELINTVRGMIEGVVEIVLNPEAFFRGIGQLVYLGLMMELSRYGYPPAVEYVGNFVGLVAQQLGRMTSGLAVLQRNMPTGVEFVRDMQTSFQWRVIWEVLGLFVGVGEAVALFDAIRGGRAAAAMSELLAGFRGVRALEEAGTAGRVLEGAGDTGRLLEGAGDASRVLDGTGDAASAAGRTGDVVGDTGRAADVVGDSERAVAHADDARAAPVDTAADSTRATDTAGDGERAAGSADRGGEGGGRPPEDRLPSSGGRDPHDFTEWEQDMLEGINDDLSEHGIDWEDLGHGGRGDVVDELRRASPAERERLLRELDDARGRLIEEGGGDLAIPREEREALAGGRSADDEMRASEDELADLGEARADRFNWQETEHELSVMQAEFTDLPPEGWLTQPRIFEGEVATGRMRRGTTIPERYHPGTATHPPVSLEAKNYFLDDVAVGENPELMRDFLERTADQARRRGRALPPNAEQYILIDLRGQVVSPAAREGIIRDLFAFSDGALQPGRIRFLPP